jgi:hypothetical protein
MDGSSSEGADTAASAEEVVSSQRRSRQSKRSRRRHVLVEETAWRPRAMAKLLTRLLKLLGNGQAHQTRCVWGSLLK